MNVAEILPDKFMMFVTGSRDKLVAEIYASLHRFASSDARAKWKSQARKCKRAATENEFFTDEEKKDMRTMGQEPHIVNKLVTGVQGASSISTSNRPDIKVFPLRETDPYLSELVKVGIEHVWLKNFGNDVIYDIVEERNISGIGSVSGRIDYSKGPFGAVTFEEDDADLWYWDENSKKRDRGDTHLIKAQLRSLSYIKSHYPELADEKIVAVNDWEDDTGTRPNTNTGQDNYRPDPKSPSKRPDESKTKRMVWEIEAYMLRVEEEHWAVVTTGGEPFVIRLEDAKSASQAQEDIAAIKRDGIPTPDGQGTEVVQEISYWPRQLSNRYKTIVVGAEVIPQDDPVAKGQKKRAIRNPLGLDSDGDPVLPIVFYYAQRTSKAYYHSPTYYAYDSNKSLCKRESQYTLAISKILSAPVQRESSGTRWRFPDRPDTPGNELLIDKSSREATRLNPGNVDLGALTARIIEDKANIDEAYGLPEVLRGKAPQGLERISGRLGLALQDSATMMHNPAFRGLESCMERLGKMLLALMLMCWPRWKWESLVTDDRIDEFRPVNERQPNDPPDEQKGNDELAQERQQRLMSWNRAIDKITRDGISVVDFNLAITAGSSLPTNRLLKEETALERYKLGLYDRRAALEYSDDPHAKEIAARMDKREMQLAQLGAVSKKGSV
jgi:hypothetical protein